MLEVDVRAAANRRAEIRCTVRKVRGSARALMRGPVDGFVRGLGCPPGDFLVGPTAHRVRSALGSSVGLKTIRCEQ